MDLNVKDQQERQLFAAALPTHLNREDGVLLELERDASAMRESAFGLIERMTTDGLLEDPSLAEVVVGVQRAANELRHVERLLDHAIAPGVRRRGVAPGFSEEAALVIGIAGTALAFARTCEDEVDRWLRVLRLHGQAGRLLQALGLPDAPLAEGQRASAEAALARIGDPVRKVGLSAANVARVRHSGAITTIDLLFAVAAVYGSAFDRALTSRGTSSGELFELLAGGRSA